MAYGTKHRCEFYDIKGLEWRWDFELDGYSSTINTMQASGSPATYEPLSDSDDLFDSPVRGIKATLRVKSNSLFQYAEFYTMTDLMMRCSIYHGASHTLYFRGYVQPFNYSEPYDDYPYDVEISVTCGLAALKNFKYEASAGVPYAGRKLKSQILLDILGKISVVTFSEIINIYENGMSAGTGDSPLDQVEPDVSLFDDMNCYEVLEHLLSQWNALMRQRSGIFFFYRPTEMIATAYVRTFTAATTKTGTTITSIQKIRRSSSPTADLRDHNGGKPIFLSPAKKLTLHQDFGYKESWLLNWELKANTFDIATNQFSSWSCHNCFLLSSILPEEDSGMAIPAVSARRNASYTQSSSFGDNLKTTADLLGFAFDYYIYSYLGSTLSNVYLDMKIKNDDTNQWLSVKDDYDMEWITSESFVSVLLASVENGRSGWTTFSRKIPTGLPAGGSYTITIYNPYCASSFAFTAAFRNIKIFSTSDVIVVHKWRENYRSIFFWHLKRFSEKVYVDVAEIVKKDYIIANAINGDELEKNYLLGDVVPADSDIDNIIEQFRGALALVDYLTQTAADFVTAHGASFTGILVTSSGRYIYFTENDGNDFTGATSIINATGNLAGTVLTTVPHLIAKAQIDQLVILTGTVGSSIDITIISPLGTVTRRCSWNTDPATTVAGFLVAGAGHVAAFAAIGITLTGNDTVPSDGFIFTGGIGLANAFTSSAVIFYGSMTWNLGTDQNASDAQARVDRIELSGNAGTAKIVCDNVPSPSVANITVVETFMPTASWSRRGGSENDPILQIIGGELGAQMIRPRQMLSLPIHDLDENDLDPHVDPIGCFQDDINLDGAIPRIFAFNRGVFDMKNRHWDIDMVEIVQ
jgi:hypothetical protein